MRFFFYDNEVLELTFQTLLAGCRLGNHTVADRAKMESILELFITKFFKIDFLKIVAKSRTLTGIAESDVNLILGNPQDYYNAKINGWKYVGASPIDATEAPVREIEVPQSQSSPDTTKDSINIQPSQASILLPAFKEGYSLLFGTPHFYVLIKLIATIYERFMKA